MKRKSADQGAPTGPWTEPPEVITATQGSWTGVTVRGSITDHQTKALRSHSDATLRYRGPFRVYFNRKEDAPRVVSIDDGSHTWEILCKSVTIRNVELKSKYESASGCLVGSGSIEVRDGCATIL